MSVKSEQAVTVLFATANASTGAATDATGTPVGTLYVDGTANGAPVTVTNITQGVYKAALTLPTLTAGQVVSLRVAATVGGIAAEGVVWQEVADTARASDVYSAVDNIAVTGAAINTTATTAVVTTGGETNTYASTYANDGTRHSITDTAGAMELYYQFSVGGDGVPTGVYIDGYLTGSNDTLTVYGYNWGTSTWDAIGTYAGQVQATDVSRTYPLFTTMVGSGANLGLVRVRFYAAAGLTTATLAIDQLYCEYSVVNRSVGYLEGSVWIDTVNGAAGTTSYINGTADNPVSTIADAYTLATALGLNAFRLFPGSEVTLTASAANQHWQGAGVIHLGGQSIADALFRDAYTIDGTGTGDDATFINCGIGTATIPHSYFSDCRFKGVLTFNASDDYFIIRGSDTTPSAGAAARFVFAGNDDAMFRDWRGGIELQSMAAGDVAIIDGAGRLVIEATCTGGSITVCGDFADPTGSAAFEAAGGTLTETARYATDQINAEVVDALATDVIADSVPADGSRPTIAQALYMLTQFMFERSVSSTTVTVKKPDGSTGLMTFTLDSGTLPTSITRTT